MGGKPCSAALRAYWSDDRLELGTLHKGERIMAAVTATADSVPATPSLVRGRGMACGLAFADSELAGKVSAAAFEAACWRRPRAPAARWSSCCRR